MTRSLPWLLELAEEGLAARPTVQESKPCSVCQAEDAEERCEGCKVPLCDEHAQRDIDYIPLCKQCYADSAVDEAVGAGGETAGEPVEASS